MGLIGLKSRWLNYVLWYTVFFLKSLWFCRVRICYHELYVCMHVCLKMSASIFCTRCCLGRDTEPYSGGYYWALILTLLKLSHASQVVCKDLPNSWDFFLSWIWESLRQTPFSAGSFCCWLSTTIFFFLLFWHYFPGLCFHTALSLNVHIRYIGDL